MGLDRCDNAPNLLLINYITSVLVIKIESLTPTHQPEKSKIYMKEFTETIV